MKNWLELHKITVGLAGTVAYVEIPIECAALQPDGLCGLWGMPSRPKMCNDWPGVPSDLKGLEAVCTYGFEGVES